MRDQPRLPRRRRLDVADALEVQVAIHSDTLNESGFVENTLAAIRVEEPEWFTRSHEEVRRWFDEEYTPVLTMIDWIAGRCSS